MGRIAVTLAAAVFALLFFSIQAEAVRGDPPIAWRSVGPGGGGALFAPSWSPHDPNEIYLACDMSEQFRSTNGGVTWKMTPFTRIQAGRDAPKVQFTSDPLVRYSIDFTNEVLTPARTTDGGLTWTPLPGDPTGAGAWNIVADPANTNRVYVTDYSRLYVSTNGGASFALKYTGADSGAGLRIAGTFFDANTTYFGTNDGVLVSTNGGTSFSLAAVGGIPSTQRIVGFAGGKSGGVTRFLCTTLGSGDVYVGVQGDDHWNYAGVYSLDWGAANWVSRGAGIPAGHHPFFAGMARNEINTMYVAGGSTAGVPIVDKSTNGGATWQSTLLTAGNANVATGWQGAGGDRDWTYGELCFGFDVHPTDANRMAFTDYGYVHLSTNGGTSWRQGYVDPATQNPAGANTPKGRSYRGVGLENTTCWSLAWASTNNMWASFSDIRGVRSGNGGDTWNFYYTGHSANSSYRVVVHPVTGVMYMATSSVHDMYQSTRLTDSTIDGGTGNVLFSTNGGAAWQTMGSLGKPVVWVSLDPTNANRIYAAMTNSSTGGIYVCNNIAAGTGATWTKLASPPRTQGHAFNIVVLNDGSLVCTYSGRRAGSPQNFTDSSGVYHSTDGGLTWADRSHANMHWWTKDVVIDPTDAGQNRWYVGVFSGWGGAANDRGGLYRTTNRGLNWTQVSDRTRVTSCTIDPANADELYMTTEMEGLWYTSNATAGAPAFSLVDNFPFRQPERVFFNPHKPGEIWVTSFGHGMNVSTFVPGDCDGNGTRDAADVPCFVGLLLNGGSAAAKQRCDFDASGTVDGTDIAAFVECLLAGCP